MSDIAKIPMLKPTVNEGAYRKEVLSILGDIHSYVAGGSNQFGGQTTPAPTPSSMPTQEWDQKPEEEKVGKKNDKKMKEFFRKMGDGVKNTFKGLTDNPELKKHASRAILGPLSLILTPLNQTFGLSGKFGKLFGGLFKKKDKKDKKKKDNKALPDKKIPPKENMIKKYGIIGAVGVYLGRILKGDDDNKKKGKGIFSNLLSSIFGGAAGAGMAAKIGPILGKVLPIAGIIASLLWAVMDGLAGMKKAEEWGVGKSDAFIGAFLGGTGSGWKNAFKNAGKWALMGVSVGFLAGGPVGAIIGGLLGAAIGGILGFIGGEKIAKFVKGVGAFFKKAIGAVWKGIKGIGSLFGWIGKRIWKGLKAATKFVAKVGSMVVNIVKQPFLWMFDFFKGSPEKKKEMIKELGKNIGKFVGAIFDFIMKPIKKIFPALRGPIDKFKQIMGSMWGALTSFFAGIGEGLGKASDWAMTYIIKPVGNFINNLIIKPLKSAFQKIVKFFVNIGDWFGFVWDRIKSGDVKGIFSKTKLQEFKYKKDEKRYAESRKNLKTDPEFATYLKERMKTNKRYAKWIKQNYGKMDFKKIARFESEGQVGQEYLKSQGIEKPIGSYHIGTRSATEGLAYLRNNEEVLSPMESARYRSMYNETGQDKNIQNLISSVDRTGQEQINYSAETVTVLKELLDTLKKKEMSPNINNVIPDDMGFNADMYRMKLAY